VFVTAYDQYAAKAFDVSAIDYLLKPYDRERFERALQRARESASGAERSSDSLAQLLAGARNQERYARRLLVSADGRSSFVPIRELVRLEADGNNAVVHARRGRFVLRATLESLEARLDPGQFVRVHRTHVVNIDEIAEINPWFRGDYQLKLRDGTELPWSRRYAVKRPDLLKNF